MRCLASFIVVFIFPLALRCQEVGKRLQLLELGTHAPIEGACIRHLGTGERTVSGEGGAFFMRRIGEGDSILVAALGYEEKMVNVAALQGSAPIFLKPTALQLQELTITSGNTSISRTITSLDIRLRSISNAQEVLRLVPGLFIGQHAGGGKAEQLFLRGFDVDHGTDVSITVDGTPVNMVSHAHGQGYADLHFLIPELIEGVQFRKGPYASDKGDFTTAGSVDFKTKTRLTNSIVKLEGGQFGSYRVVGLANLVNREERSLYAAGEWMKTRGYFDHAQDLVRMNLFMKYEELLTAGQRLTFSAHAFKSSWNASGQVPLRAVNDGTISRFGAIDPNEGGLTSRVGGNAQLESTLSPDARLTHQLYFTRYAFDLYSNFTFFLRDSVNGDQIRQKELRGLYGYNGTYKHTGFAGSHRLVTEGGVQLRADHTTGSRLSYTKDRSTLLGHVQLGDIRQYSAGAFFSSTLQWSRFFSANLGLRLDHFRFGYHNTLKDGKGEKDAATVMSPKVNLYFHPGQKTEIAFSAGKGFHSNDARVVLGARAREALPAAYATDLSINTKPLKNLFVHASLWHLSLDQEFIYVGDEGIVEPGGKTTRSGAELSLRYQAGKKLFLDADVNYAKARVKGAQKGADYIPLAPVLTCSGGISYKAATGLSGSLRYKYMGDRPANEDYSVEAAGYFVTDAALSFTAKKIEYSLSVQNLLNTSWKETQFETTSRLRSESEPVTEIHFTPGTPLSLRLGFTYTF